MCVSKTNTNCNTNAQRNVLKSKIELCKSITYKIGTVLQVITQPKITEVRRL